MSSSFISDCVLQIRPNFILCSLRVALLFFLGFFLLIFIFSIFFDILCSGDPVFSLAQKHFYYIVFITLQNTGSEKTLQYSAKLTSQSLMEQSFPRPYYYPKVYVTPAIPVVLFCRFLIIGGFCPSKTTQAVRYFTFSIT